LVGGKGFALAQLTRSGLRLPKGICVTSEAYQHFVDASGLREKIQLELNRKAFEAMRWEEIWDTALRIRGLFLQTALPQRMAQTLMRQIDMHFAGRATAVRSSASDEDSAQGSFAGLHESYLNIEGTAAIVDHIKLVWASLWSDAALLYRRELGLNPENSAMAVVVQEIVSGTSSGVAFSQNPNDDSESVIEAVYGLNQGLVDGIVTPDRWQLDRATGKVIAFSAAVREHYLVAGEQGVKQERLPEHLACRAPLTESQVADIMHLARQAESFFGHPQDVEWTIRGQDIYVLQSRPITTIGSADPQDKRGWYLSLHRSFENLKALRHKIETELIPAMIQEAETLAHQRLDALTDEELVTEIRRREEINTRWANIYWADFIPFAHGMRLFGQVYNDTVRPQDPYEFMSLLGQSGLQSTQRNQLLSDMAHLIQQDDALQQRLRNREGLAADEPLARQIDAFVERFGDLACPTTAGAQCSYGSEGLIRLLLEMAEHLEDITTQGVQGPSEDRAHRFLDHFEGTAQREAAELLDLARASYRLRDDDNIYMGRIEAQMMAAIEAGRQRVAHGQTAVGGNGVSPALKALVKDRTPSTKTDEASEPVPPNPQKARQLTGQPAGPGISNGPARVIQDPADLARFKYGEVLVCDAVDPNMTFIVPLAAGVVERRGGMLIHGAIIAREYGLPCVTGIPHATRLIQNGDRLIVDGFLGIVTIR
jgi:pyruvate,water dikinase